MAVYCTLHFQGYVYSAKKVGILRLDVMDEPVLVVVVGAVPGRQAAASA